MSDMYTNGNISWSELTTSNPQAAVEFYGALFGWQFDVMPMPEGTYYVASNQGEKIAGIMQAPPDIAHLPANWGQYVTVKDIDETAHQITALGGNIIVPKTAIPSVGEFILFQDPQGAVLSVIQYVEGES